MTSPLIRKDPAMSAFKDTLVIACSALYLISSGILLSQDREDYRYNRNRLAYIARREAWLDANS